MAAEAERSQPTRVGLLRQVCDPRNERAWADFHRLYAPMIKSFLRRMGVTEADAEDATQEILMIAHDALRGGKYDPEKGRFRAWLYGVARKKALVAHRNRRRPSRAQARPREDGVDLLGNIEDPHTEAEQRIWDQEWHYAVLAEAMRQVRQTLSPNVYQAFLQFGVQRRKVEEVARELGISTSSVYVYKKRGLKAVREWVAAYEGHPPEHQP